MYSEGLSDGFAKFKKLLLFTKHQLSVGDVWIWLTSDKRLNLIHFLLGNVHIALFIL